MKEHLILCKTLSFDFEPLPGGKFGTPKEVKLVFEALDGQKVCIKVRIVQDGEVPTGETFQLPEFN